MLLQLKVRCMSANIRTSHRSACLALVFSLNAQISHYYCSSLYPPYPVRIYSCTTQPTYCWKGVASFSPPPRRQQPANVRCPRTFRASVAPVSISARSISCSLFDSLQALLLQLRVHCIRGKPSRLAPSHTNI